MKVQTLYIVMIVLQWNKHETSQTREKYFEMVSSSFDIWYEITRYKPIKVLSNDPLYYINSISHFHIHTFYSRMSFSFSLLCLFLSLYLSFTTQWTHESIIYIDVIYIDVYWCKIKTFKKLIMLRYDKKKKIKKEKKITKIHDTIR